MHVGPAENQYEPRLQRERRFLWFEHRDEMTIKTEYDSGNLVTKIYANDNQTIIIVVVLEKGMVQI